jgi:cobalt/nickel transport system permease protein
MHIDRLEFKTSPFIVARLQRFDARCRIIVGVLLIAVSVNLHSRTLLAALAVLAFVLLLKERAVVVRRLIPVNVFAAMLTLALPLGARLDSPLTASPPYAPALASALLYALRINIAALHYMIFILPLGIGELSNTLRALRVPPKLVTLLALSHRAVFVLAEKVFVSSLALRMRKPARLSKREELRSYGSMIATSVVAAQMRSEKVWTAMRSRGFSESFPITRTFAWTRKDAALLAACALVAAALLALDATLTDALPWAQQTGMP